MKHIGKVSIHIGTDLNSVGGPSKVAKNLIKGFDVLNVEYEINTISNINGCLQSSCHQYMNLPNNSVMGPNLFVLPSEHPGAILKYKNFICPSLWVKNLYKSFPIMQNSNIFVWASGIDTGQFSKLNKTIKYDCFIYIKNSTNQVSNHQINELENKLIAKGLTYKKIVYGEYTEDQLIQTCSECSFCILFTGTESQGIAYMEILATNTPCYVIDQTNFKYNMFNYSYASATPYFDNTCGVVGNLELDKFDIFLNSLNTYSSREYIENNFTLKLAAEKYLQILEECHAY